MKALTKLCLFVLALVLSGCELDGSGDGEGRGHLTLGITDAAVDEADRVVVHFDGVEIKPADGPAETFPYDGPPLDLMTLQGGNSSLLLDSVEVPAGRYNWIRLMVDAKRNTMDSYVDLKGGGRVSLYVPSGEESGLKLVSGFVVPVGGSIDLTVDFDLRKSVHRPDGLGDFVLRPALRLMETDTTGQVAGTVELDPATCTSPAVYAYSGHGVTPDDEGSANPPLTSAPVVLDTEDGFYRYKVAFLPEGDYTVAYTCEADADEPGVDDPITFAAQANATVSAGTTSRVDLGAGN